MTTDGTEDLAMARLLWKEWREVWPILGGGVVLLVAAFALWLCRERPTTAGAWWVVGVVGMFGVLMGGRAFASDSERGTDAFLLAQAVEREKVWLAKAAFGVGLPVLLAASAFLVEALGHRLPVPNVYGHEPHWAWFLALALSATAATASVSLLCSTIIPTTLTASLAGAGCVWLLVVGHQQIYGWDSSIRQHAPLRPFDNLAHAVAPALIVIAAALLTSYLIFRRQPTAR